MYVSKSVLKKLFQCEYSMRWRILKQMTSQIEKEVFNTKAVVPSSIEIPYLRRKITESNLISKSWHRITPLILGTLYFMINTSYDPPT